MWVYMLKSNDEAFDAFKRFRDQVEGGPEKKVKVFRTDIKGEFTSKEFTSHFKEAGILIHFRSPYTPQQNSVVERRNRTVVEMAKSYLKEMQLPSILLGEAIRHSMYVLSRLSTRALSGQMPYKAWSGRKANISHSCMVHMKIPAIQVKKLDDRRERVVNLGKEPWTKAYHLYDPLTDRVYVSKDVTFEENKPWPWD